MYSSRQKWRWLCVAFHATDADCSRLSNRQCTVGVCQFVLVKVVFAQLLIEPRRLLDIISRFNFTRTIVRLCNVQTGENALEEKGIVANIDQFDGGGGGIGSTGWAYFCSVNRQMATSSRVHLKCRPTNWAAFGDGGDDKKNHWSIHNVKLVFFLFLSSQIQSRVL